MNFLLRYRTPVVRILTNCNSSPASLVVSRSHHCESNPSSSIKRPEGWRVLRMAHVAIATPDVSKASALYRDLFGLNVSEVHPAPDHRVNTVMVNVDNALVELLDAKGYEDKSPINKFLEKSKKGGVHHICFEVDNIKAALTDLTSKGIRSLDPEPRIGARGNPVAFLHPSDCNGVLIELEETH